MNRVILLTNGGGGGGTNILWIVIMNIRKRFLNITKYDNFQIFLNYIRTFLNDLHIT